MRLRALLLVVAACAFIAALLVSGGGDPSRTIGMDPRVETPSFPLSPMARAVGETAGAGKLVEASRWQTLAAVAYLEVAQAEEARRVAARSRAPVSRGGAPVSGACTGGPVSAAVVQNESGGDPNAWNTQGSGAWGCWQIVPGTWAGLGCEGTHGSASVDQQRVCAERVYAEQGRGAWSAPG